MENPFSRFEDRRRERDAERMRLNKRLAELAADGEKDGIAVAQLKAIYPNGFPTAALDQDIDMIGADAIEAAPAPPARALEMQQRGGDATVKQMAEAILRDAHPNGLTASQIKGKAFLRFKKHLNPNTLTVSLVRLKPRVMCENRIWFYVKPNGNGAHDAAKEKSPEVTGLL
jgi:hypothetical protein